MIPASSRAAVSSSSGADEPEPRAPSDGQAPPRRLREFLWRMVDEHGDSYVREGVKLVRTVRIVAVLVGVAAVVAAIALGTWLLK